MNTETEQEADAATDFTFKLAESLDSLIFKALDCVHPDFRPTIYYHTLVLMTAYMFSQLEPKDLPIAIDARLSKFIKEVLAVIEQYET